MFKDNIWPYLAFTAWISLATAGIFGLVHYASLGVDPTKTLSAWPQSSRLKFDSQKFNMVLFLHPRCSCSAATLGELERLLAKIHRDISLKIIFYQPANAEAGWLDSPNWRQARAIDEAAVTGDANGTEAQLFGVQNSGHVMLFDKTGVLKFSGGITPARGHMGDSRGHDAVLEAVKGQLPAAASSSVFGCSFDNIAAKGSND